MNLYSLLITIIRRKPLISLFLVVSLTTYSYLALSAIGYVYSLYRVNEVFVDIEDGIVISNYAYSPLTSLIDSREVMNLLRDIEGIDVEFYLITLVFIYDKPTVVRSTENNAICGCLIAAEWLMRELGLETGDVIPVYSPFTHKTVFYRICGVVDKPYSLLCYRDMVDIRNTSPGYYSIGIIRVVDESAISDLSRVLGFKSPEYRLLSRILVFITRRERNLHVEIYEDISLGYINRLGLIRDFIFYFAYAVAMISALNMPLVGIGLVTYLNRELEVFTYIGLSREKIFIYISVFSLISTTISLLVVYILMTLDLYLPISVLGFSTRLHVETLDYLYIYIYQVFLLLLGLIYGLREHVK